MTTTGGTASRTSDRSAPRDEEFDFRRMFRCLWKGRLIIVITVIAALAVALLFLRFSSPLYTASMVLMPVTQDTQAQGLSQYRGLASTVGIQLPTPTSATPFQQFVSTLTSTRLAVRLEREHDMLKTIYRSRWDADEQAWQPPDGVKSRVEMVLNWLTGRPTWRAPSADALAAHLKQNLAVRTDDTTGMVTVEYSAADPAFAASFLRLVHSESDRLVKEDALERAQSNVEYLKAQLQVTTALDTRNVLIGLLVSQENGLMLMSSDLPFAATFVDPPFASGWPSRPRPLLMLALAAFGGLLLGCVVVLTRASLRTFRLSSDAAEQEILS